jgi:hypothetical protein
MMTHLFKKMAMFGFVIGLSLTTHQFIYCAYAGTGEPQNKYIIPLVEDHADEQIRALFTDLRDNHPQFFALGGKDGRNYRIEDPDGEVASFLLSGNAPMKMNYQDAIDYCTQLGARLAIEIELEALSRANTMPDGKPHRYIAETWKAPFWSSSMHPYWALNAFYYDGDKCDVKFAYCDHKFSVRCVLPAKW